MPGNVRQLHMPACRRILAVTPECSQHMQTIMKEFMKGEGLKAPKAAMWAAFRSLQMSNILRPCNTRRRYEGPASKQPVDLSFCHTDIAVGIPPDLNPSGIAVSGQASGSCQLG
jgi:hypothetical protein